jgi:hypothetical protein
MTKVLFSKKIKKVEKLMTQRDRLLAIKCHDYYLPSTAHDDHMVETPNLREAREKTKQNTIMDCNMYIKCIDEADQIYYYCKKLVL